jgi:hypothetical protein
MSRSPLHVATAHAVEAFEAAVAAGHTPDLAEFAPPAGDPYRPRVLAELIRVDLEYCWRAGRPVAFDDYRHRFPDAFSPTTLPELAFEEYRLRRHAGEDVRPDEYAARYGVSVSDWELIPPGSLAVRYRTRFLPSNDATAIVVRPQPQLGTDGPQPAPAVIRWPSDQVNPSKHAGGDA